MAYKLASKKLLLASIEGSRGVAQGQAGTDAVLIATDPTLTPLAGETVSRELMRGFFGSSGSFPVGTHQTLEFSVELAGSGAAGTAPGWGVLLQAAGMKETVTANTKVVYGPRSADPETADDKTLTLRYNMSGILHTLTGCRGTWSLESGANLIPRLKFTFTGLWAAPVDQAAATPDYSTWKQPLVGSNTNTPTFSLFGAAGLRLNRLSLDYGGEVIYRETIGGANSTVLVDRATTGSVTVDMEGVSVLDPFSKARAGDTGALEMVHGVGAGKIVEIDCPRVQLTQPSYAEDAKLLQWSSDFEIQPNAGNDELTIEAR